MYIYLDLYGSPSKVKGAVRFAGPRVIITGECTVSNNSDGVRTLQPGTYTGDVDITEGQEGDASMCVVA